MSIRSEKNAVAGHVSDADVDDRRDRDDRRAARTARPSGATTAGCRARGASTPCTARSVAAPRRPRAPRRAGSRGRRRHRPRPRLDATTLTTTILGAAQEHLVERGQAGREPVERELELGDDVAQQVEVARRRRSRLRRGRRRRPPAGARGRVRRPSSSRARTDVDGDGAGALEQRVGRAGDDQSAGVDHHDVVAHLLHVVEQVRGHQHGDAERSEPSNEREHVVAPDRVEAGGRFVEQDELGIADDRLGELRALPHPGRELADRPESRLVEPDEVEDVGRSLARGARRQPAQLAERRDDVGGGLVEGQAVVLGHVAEPRPHADRIARDVDAAHLDVALGRVGEAEQEPKRRRLARAVRADETDAPARHLDAQVVERGGARIALRQSVDAKKRSGVHDGRESVTWSLRRRKCRDASTATCRSSWQERSASSSSSVSQSTRCVSTIRPGVATSTVEPVVAAGARTRVPGRNLPCRRRTHAHDERTGVPRVEHDAATIDHNQPPGTIEEILRAIHAIHRPMGVAIHRSQVVEAAPHEARLSPSMTDRTRCPGARHR